MNPTQGIRVLTRFSQFPTQQGSVTLLEAFAMNDAWTGLIIFCLGDPHWLEGAQRGQN